MENEELLQLVYSKFETDADYETFKADLMSNEDLQKMAYGKLQTEADFETFRTDLIGEKKNPDLNQAQQLPAQEIVQEDTASPLEDGSSDLPEPSVASDMWNSLKAGTKEALAGISGIPNLINKSVFSLVAPKEMEDYVNTLKPQEREVFINGIIKQAVGVGTPASLAAGGQESAEAQEKLTKEAEDVRSKMTKYDASITEDLGKGEFKQAGRRIAVEGVGAIPSIVQAMIPYVGLASVGAGTAANKQERLEEAGEDFGGMTPVNSALTGLTESLLEKYTAKQGKQLIKALIGKGDRAVISGVKGFLTGLKEVGKGALKEGGTEALQAASENLIDAITTGNEKEAFDIFTEISDSFLIGMVVGAPMKGGEVSANAIQQAITKKNTDVPEGGVTPLDIPALDENGNPINRNVEVVEPTPVPEPTNVSSQTQGFFGNVVEGNLDKYKPAKPYEYEADFTEGEASFKEKYDSKKGNFDEHIATSIPTFRDVQIKKGAAITKMLPEGGLIIDLGGSEGGFVKSITEESGGKIKSINVDPNPSMKAAHESSPVEGSQFVQAAFQEGFDNVPAFKPEQKADIVHESMLFQFISPERASKIKEIKENYIKSGGLFITEEKFKLDNAETEAQNEKLKDTQHKNKYYTEEQIKAKGESVLLGMDKNQASFDEYVSELKKQFKHVETYWKAGNFRGVVASDTKGKVDSFLQNIGDLGSVTEKYNASDAKVPTPKKQKRTVTIKDSNNNDISVDLDAISYKRNQGNTKNSVLFEASHKDFPLGTINLMERKDGKYQVVASRLNKDAKDIERKGIGTEIYEAAIRDFSKEDKIIMSDVKMNDKAKGVWNKLVKKGLAKKLNNEQYESLIVKEQPVSKAPKTVEERVNKKIASGRKKGLSDAEILSNIKDKEQNRTAKILLKREQDENITPKEAAAQSKEVAEKARKAQAKKSTKNVSTVSSAINRAVDLFTDRQGAAKRNLKRAGFDTTLDFMVAKLGTSSQAKNLVDKAHARTFDRLTEQEVRDLEEIILQKRTISIDENRTKRGLAPVLHQGNITSVSAKKALEGYKERLGEKQFSKLEKRAEAFFDEYKGLLKTMKEEGLISEETYDIFAEVDYQQRQYLDFLTDMEGNFLSEELENFETGSLSKEQIKSMKGGSEGLQNMDSQGLLQRSILARTKAVFANRLNSVFATELDTALAELSALEKKTDLTKQETTKLGYLKEIASNVKKDRIIGFSESTGKPKYALASANTKGYTPIYFYKDGVPNRIWLKDEFHTKFTDTSNQILSTSARESISKGTGSRLVKTLATGNNPLFLITNVPRDLAFALAFSKEYGNGAKTFVPLEALKLLKDFGKGAKSAMTRDNLFNKYLEYGGGMDFLTIQGRYGKEGIFNRYVENKVADKFTDFGKVGAGRKAKDFMNWIKKVNTASEFATRIGVFDRSIKNQLGDRKISDLTKEEQDILYTKAIRSARELTDFNQGGRFTKSLDSAVPYLNAAVQGTRSAVNNYAERPVETTSRILQIAGGFTAMGMVAAFGLIAAGRDDSDDEIKGMTDQEIYFETLRAVSPYDLKNYYIFPEGKKDKDGNWMYYRVAKAQSLSPFINTAEHYLRKFYSEAHGINYKQDLDHDLWETINTNVLPLELNPLDAATRVPMVDAAFAWNGIDAYTGNPLNWDRGKIPAELEGIVDDRVEGFYKKIGEGLGVSPVRLKSATESFITTPSTNPYVGFGYLGAEYMTSGEKKDIVKDFIKTAGKRVYKKTSEYNVITKAKERVSDEVVEAYRKHILVEKEVRDAVRDFKKTDNPEPFEKTFEKIYKDKPEMLDKAVKWAKSEVEKKKLNPFVSSLRFEENKDVRAIMLAERFGDALLKTEDHYTDKEKQILKELIQEKVVDKEVYEKYKKLF